MILSRLLREKSFRLTHLSRAAGSMRKCNVFSCSSLYIVGMEDNEIEQVGENAN